MVGCRDLKKGQTLYCEDCGMELKVTKTCSECGPKDTCCAGDCTFECCGESLKVK
ncbi:MAG: hypothetical protein ABR879_08780 [Methanomassiliicoccales archaeon]|jgi:hypothetical protein